MRTRFVARVAALLFLCGLLTAQAQITRAPNVIHVANEAATGTAQYKLVKLTGAPSKGIVTSAGDMIGAVGVCASGCGIAAASAIANIVEWGNTSCVFDGPTTAGNYIGISATAVGECTDAGAAYPVSGPVLGRVLSTNVGAGTYPVVLFSAGISAVAPTPPTPASGGSGVTFYPNDATIIPIGVQNDNQLNTLLKIPSGTAEVVDQRTVVSPATPVAVMEAHLWAVGLGTATIDAGVWQFNTYAAVSNAGDVSQILVSVYRVRTPADTIEVTGGPGVVRTATSAGALTFVAATVDVGGTIDSDSYLQTPTGLFRILSRPADDTITFGVPATYVNEGAGTAFKVWKRLIGGADSGTGEVNNTAIAPLYAGIQIYTTNSVQVAFAILSTDALGAIYYAQTASAAAKTLYYSHDGSTRYSRFTTPLVVRHNDLAGLQGGSVGNYFHLDSFTADVAKVTAGIAAAATANNVSGPTFCADAGGTDAYACNLSPAIAAYVTGAHYRFKANTVNTGAATLALNGIAGPVTIKKAMGGITTDLSNDDIRAGQWVDVVYDGTNFQVQSGLGKAAGGGVAIEWTAARCNNAVASPGFSTPAAGAPTAACVAGANTLYAILQFTDASTQTVQDRVALPSTWAAGITALDIVWRTPAIAGDVKWQIATACVADTETGDPAWNAADSIVDTAKGVANQFNNATIAVVTTTGCAAGESLFFRFFRNPADGSDTLGDTAELISIKLSL
jgi:hypothetical protein